MTAGAAKRIWASSRASNGSLLVLLAIADECGEEEFTEMKIADLAVKCRLSDKGARLAVKDLVSLGELSVESRTGAVSRYALRVTPVKTTGPTPVKTTGVTERPGKNYRGPTPVKTTGVTEEPQVSGTTPVKTTGPEISDERSTSVVSGRRSRPSSSEAVPRPDIDRVCTHLADRIEGNGAKRPNITGKWRDAARLLIDKDGRTERQVHNMIDWCQDSEFWRSNIMSMPKLREKYDSLKMKAEAGLKPPAGRQNPDDEYASALKRIQARKEGANGTRGDRDNRPAGQVSLPPAAG